MQTAVELWQPYLHRSHPECKRGRVMVICLFTERPQWLQHRSAVAGLPTLLEKPSGFAISPVNISVGWCSVKDVHWAWQIDGDCACIMMHDMGMKNSWKIMTCEWASRNIQNHQNLPNLHPESSRHHIHSSHLHAANAAVRPPVRAATSVLFPICPFCGHWSSSSGYCSTKSSSTRSHSPPQKTEQICLARQFSTPQIVKYTSFGCWHPQVVLGVSVCYVCLDNQHLSAIDPGIVWTCLKERKGGQVSQSHISLSPSAPCVAHLLAGACWRCWSGQTKGPGTSSWKRCGCAAAEQEKRQSCEQAFMLS